ncbi:hypothetical protein GCM10028803_41090 [Larkinella knui]|uniref:Uncharacterized protein n=1 Tax=Larkinella knui TaxID=2025310 RepID=A0A3P1CN30_9BACT|nr:hypothetical protein [Larkinella knui]RRB14741.1 hypothetical protein EHT87_09225 [Larkinella knui]
MANQQANALINSTMETFNGDTTSISTLDGISLIDTWLTALRSGETDQATNPISHTLSELKTQLQESDPDSGQIKALLNDLADQTEKAAQSADDKEKMQLNELVQTLRDFGRVINGEGGSIEEKHGRAQIFTQTGTGSAAGNPGVNPAVSGNAGTGDEGNVQGGGSYGSGYGTGSSGESGRSNSGTDTRTTRTSTGEGGGNSHQI